MNLETKLNTLINWIQDPTIGPERRFQLLQEIAEEAARYKLGGDDKIRVAGGACDGVSVRAKRELRLWCLASVCPSTPIVASVAVSTAREPTSASQPGLVLFA